MNTLKPLAIIAVLAAVGFGLYRNINSGSDSSGGLADMWGDVPTVVMPEAGTATPGEAVSPANGTAPPFSTSTTAPPSAPWNSPPAAGAVPSNTSSVPLLGTTSASASVPPMPAATSVPAVSSSASGVPAAAPGYPAAMNPTAISPSADPSTVGGALQGTTTDPSTSAAIAPNGQPDPGTSAGGDLSMSAAYAALRSAVQTTLDRGDLAESLFLLSRWYGDPSLSPNDKAELADLLGRLAGTVIYSPKSYIEKAYIVQPGETLQSIGEKFQVPWQLLAKINGVAQSDPFNPGRELKVLRGPFSAIISLTDRELTLMLGGRYAGRFAIGIGRDRQQIEGRWVVQQKQINPTYYGPDRTIDADNPANPLGEYMLGLAKADSANPTEVFGIHSTNDPSSIARDRERGFIRLAPADAADVFDILSIGSNVIIRR